MAAPLAVVAKVAIQAAVTKVEKKYPGGMVGLIATIVIFAIIFVTIVVGMIIAAMSAVIPQRETMPEVCIDEYGNNLFSDSTAPLHPEESGGLGTPANDGITVPESTQVVVPLPSGSYRNASGYGPRVAPTAGASTWHKGLDFAAPAGTPIYAAADGVVTLAQQYGGLGHTIVIKHNIGGATWLTRYGHTPNATQFVNAGTTVKAGQQIAVVGSSGVSTGPHLHFEVWKNSIDEKNNHVNPADWLSNNGAASLTNPVAGGGGGGMAAGCVSQNNSSQGPGPWGGHSNGKIPLTEMCLIPGTSNHYLRCDASAAFGQLNAAFTQQFGHGISITDSYRSYEQQVALKAQKPVLAAKPGTSNHGWGLAVDLGSNINKFGTAEHNWMRQNAARFGWVHPDWAQQNGSKPEAWHWEFVGSANNGGGGDGSNVAGAKSIARNMIGSYGWGQDQFACLEPMWTKESGWNYKAANPTSSARGIPQMMMSIHYGSNWKTSIEASKYLNDPTVQIKVGLDYVKGRYGSPCQAWAFWQKNNWY